jgi:hypothetical protein
VVHWLRSQGIEISEGGHAFYIRPQPALRDILEPIISFYPEGAGFKILKDLRHPRRARYLYKHRRSLALLARLIGSPHDQVLAANYMYARGIGPRVWDLTCWRIQGRSCTVFVVNHVEGSVPTLDQSTSFLSRLERLNANSHLRVLIPRWEQNREFEPPYCNGNLIYSDADGAGLYVDFQNFGLTNQRAWGDDLLSARGADRDDATERACWTFARDLLKERSRAIAGRIVLDLTCASDVAISASLADGASWGIGWCQAAQSRHVEESLLSAGATRFSLVQNRVDRDGRFEDAIPPTLRSRLKDAVVFLDVRAGSPVALDDLVRMPWNALVCVGDDREHFGRSMQGLRALSPDQFDVVAHMVPHCPGTRLTVVCRKDG